MEEVCDDIIKSPFDVRSYRYFKLKNKMQVLVIHDPTSLQVKKKFYFIIRKFLTLYHEGSSINEC